MTQARRRTAQRPGSGLPDAAERPDRATELHAAIAAEDWERGIEILQTGLSDLVGSDIQVVRTFLEELPTSVAVRDPMIELGRSVFAGLDAGTAGSVAMISRGGDSVEGLAEAGWSLPDILSAATAHLVLLRLSGEFEAGARLAAEVEELVRAASVDDYAESAGFLPLYRGQWAIVHQLAGDLAAADEQFRAAYADATQVALGFVAKNSAGTLAMNDSFFGETQRAREWMSVDRRFADPEGWLAERVRIPGRVADVLIVLDELDLAAAEEALEVLGMPTDTEEFWASMLAAHTSVLLLKGFAEMGLDLLDRVGHQFARWAPPGSFARHSMTLARADFLTVLGSGGDALHILGSMPQALPGVRVRTARVHLLRDDPAETLAALDDCGHAAYWPRAFIEMLTLSAAAHARSGGEDSARVQLSRADTVARQAGAVRPLLMLPREHRRALMKAQLVPGRLQSIWEKHDGVDVFPQNLQRVILTARELAVLRLIAKGTSRRAVAAELFVSENTVKTQLRSIYRKLGVGSRNDAVAAAHRLALL